MKIRKDLPQFTDERVLIIAAGERAAKFFTASNGIIEEKEFFKYELPKYSDQEGRFGSFEERKADMALRDFLREFIEKIKSYDKRGLDQIYLFTARYSKNELLDKIPSPIKKKVKLFPIGDYIRKHPFVLLQALKK